MNALLLYVALIAPPTPASIGDTDGENPFKAGFVFRFWNYVMEVYAIDGDKVYYQSFKHKNKNFTNNPMTRAEMVRLLKACPQKDLVEP